MDLFQILFTINGRLDRGRFWRAVLVYVCAWMLVLLIVAAVAFVFFGSRHVALDAGVLPILLSIPISIKRLHDRDKSGWWIALFYGVPLSLGYIADITDIGAEFLLSLASLALAIWGFVEIGCLRGTEGPNRFGPNPLAA